MSVTSEEQARLLAERALPTANRRQRLLAIFASSIREANESGRDCWAVTCEAAYTRLIVGHFIVATLCDDAIWLALDSSVMSASEEAILTGANDWRWSPLSEEYAEYREIPSRNGYYMPSSELGGSWPLIRRLHFDFIYRAAHGRKMDERTPAGHSNEMLRYVRNSLGEHLPDPLHSR